LTDVFPALLGGINDCPLLVVFWLLQRILAARNSVKYLLRNWRRGPVRSCPMSSACRHRARQWPNGAFVLLSILLRIPRRAHPSAFVVRVLCSQLWRTCVCLHGAADFCRRVAHLLHVVREVSSISCEETRSRGEESTASISSRCQWLIIAL
jgi:hypothetical protein